MEASILALEESEETILNLMAEMCRLGKSMKEKYRRKAIYSDEREERMYTDPPWDILGRFTGTEVVFGY